MFDPWPELPYDVWKDACDTLQLMTQIVGKTRIVLTPWINHSWHVTFDVTARGLSTPLMHLGPEALQIEFDFTDHALVFRAGDGRIRRLTLRPMAIADFYAAYLAELAALGIGVKIDGAPNEIVERIAFRNDRKHCAYDPEFVRRFWRALVSAHAVFTDFRTSFLGKVSPVHFFWGGFDLAVTRFSGRRAPLHPGGIPHLPDGVTREAYSHEVSSAGFWPGGAGLDYAAFYSYAYPAPEGFSVAKVRPAEARFDASLGEFILPYEAVRAARDPDAHLMEFLQSTYKAAADLGQWDRANLECPLGKCGVPRVVV
jgi:hypothetical protein